MFFLGMLTGAFITIMILFLMTWIFLKNNDLY